MSDHAMHTPGPWEAHWVEDHWEIGFYGRPSHVVAVVSDACRVRTLDISPGESNARLIAAAPDLLAALKAVIDRMRANGTMNRFELDYPTVEVIRAAIALTEPRP